MRADSEFLAKLQEVAMGRTQLLSDTSDPLGYWARHGKLMYLLRYGCEDKELLCGMSKLNVTKLLQISPSATSPDSRTVQASATFVGSTTMSARLSVTSPDSASATEEARTNVA